LKINLFLNHIKLTSVQQINQHKFDVYKAFRITFYFRCTADFSGINFNEADQKAIIFLSN